MYSREGEVTMPQDPVTRRETLLAASTLVTSLNRLRLHTRRDCGFWSALAGAICCSSQGRSSTRPMPQSAPTRRRGRTGRSLCRAASLTRRSLLLSDRGNPRGAEDRLSWVRASQASAGSELIASRRQPPACAGPSSCGRSSNKWCRPRARVTMASGSHKRGRSTGATGWGASGRSASGGISGGRYGLAMMMVLLVWRTTR